MGAGASTTKLVEQEEEIKRLKQKLNEKEDLINNLKEESTKIASNQKEADLVIMLLCLYFFI